MLQAAVETATQVQPVPVLNDFRELPIYALQESPTNPRRSFDEGKLFELAQSIRSQGVLVPLIERRVWLTENIRQLTCRVRHRGNHKYAWPLTAALRQSLPASLPYPKHPTRLRCTKEGLNTCGSGSSSPQ